ncbi:MAG: glycosyltransferase family 39 protein [Anaerolineae bacterium]|nr:glycosyltransferase family 39 protein [Anaerolineae bacterium]
MLCGSLLIDLAVYVPSHRSTSLVILAAAAALAALGGMAAAGIVAFRLSAESTERLRAGADRWRGVSIGGALLVLFIFGLEMRPEWVYAHIALTLGAGFALGYDLLYADSRPIPRAWLAAAGVIAIGATAIRVYGLAVYPTAQVTDEGGLLAWVVGYIKTGHFSDYLMYYGGHDVQRYYLPMAWWMQIVGIGWWQGRLYNLIMTLPLIVLTSLAARSLFGRAAGWMTAAFLFVSAVVMVGVRLRHDIGLGVAIAASLWAYSEALRRDSKPFHFAAGALMGLGWFGHYHATGFGVALALGLYLPRYVQRARQGNWRPETGFILYGLGGLVGAGIVVVFQILPDLQGFLATRELRNPLDLATYARSMLGHIGSIASHSQLELILIGAGLVAAFWRRRANDLSLALTVVLAHLALGLMAVDTWDHYPMPLTPLYAMLVAALFTDGLRRIPAPRTEFRQATAFTFAAFAAVCLGWTTTTPLTYLLKGGSVAPQPPPAAAYVIDHYDPATTLVTAEHYYYLFLWDYRFASVMSPDLMPRDRYAEFGSKAAVWDSIAPDVVIIDRNLSTCCVAPIMTTDYLDSRGYHEVAEFEGERYPVLVYAKGGGA